MRAARSKIGSVAEPSTARRRRGTVTDESWPHAGSGPRSLNAWLVAEGWALAYRRYSSAYVSQELSARSERRGIWRGRFVAPWDWRAGVRLSGDAPKSDGSAARSSSDRGRCLIKGNISRDGKRIYHVPGGQYYERTRISPSKGERWFCSEAEARTQGGENPDGRADVAMGAGMAVSRIRAHMAAPTPLRFLRGPERRPPAGTPSCRACRRSLGQRRQRTLLAGFGNRAPRRSAAVHGCMASGVDPDPASGTLPGARLRARLQNAPDRRGLAPDYGRAPF